MLIIVVRLSLNNQFLYVQFIKMQTKAKQNVSICQIVLKIKLMYTYKNNTVMA